MSPDAVQNVRGEPGARPVGVRLAAHDREAAQDLSNRRVYSACIDAWLATMRRKCSLSVCSTPM
eukprot:6673312-Lingulodinium_polyedra.AAC.1